MLLSILLQIADSVSNNSLAGTPTDGINLWEIIVKGGSTMVVLFILSIIALYVFVERFMLIQKAQASPEMLLSKVKRAVTQGDLEGAKYVCRQDGTPMAKMLVQGLEHIGSPLQNIEASIENTAKLELYRLEKNISILGTISGAAPMIGFFGTVIGMIRAFIAIAQEEGSVSPRLLSEGIYEAMVTTAGGLFVGILAYVAYNFMVRQVADVVYKMEVTSIEFLDLLQKPH
jgi:biopolymer transport protein ExbB